MDIRWLFQTIWKAVLSLISHLIQFLSFNSEIESMVDTLNHILDEPPTALPVRHFSHPGGFIREFGKRRLSIAAAYIKIARDHSPSRFEERLAALKMLIEQSLHAKTINMPLNTARVQIALMKAAVKAQGNKRKQMEALADFGLASFGHEAVIRRFLNELQLVEVPEDDKPLCELDMGWDDHVHDFLSEGRKTPTQVLLDAFVKGLSRLTLVYSNIDEKKMIQEALEAGAILGIKVNIGIEFSVGKSGGRRHYMYIPPHSNDVKAFFTFFEERAKIFAPFLEGLRTNSANRRKTMAAAIERFNTVQRSKLNEKIPTDSPGFFPTLTVEELDKIVACGQASRVHIGELLFLKFKEVFHKRVLSLKAQVLAAEERYKKGIYSEWELKNITSQYQITREQFETMTPDTLRTTYMDNRDVVDYDSEFPDEIPILDTLSSQEGKIVLIHPLEIGPKEAMTHVLRQVTRITHLETLNLRDSATRNPNDLIIFNKFIYILNNLPESDLLNFLEQHEVTGLDKATILQGKKAVENRGLVPVCGSDSTGRDPTIPGMGFIRINSIPDSIRNRFLEHHYKIPRPIADLIIREGRKTTEPTPIGSESDVVCMGKIGKPFRNYVGDESDIEFVAPLQFLTYLNPAIKELIRIAVGYLVAFYAFYQIDPEHFEVMALMFASIWFGITFFRNFFVDLIAASGFHIKSWALRNVNFDNISQSLFWTGFSVPILGIVKFYYDAHCPLAKDTMAFEAAKFFFLCISNGLYITAHNRLRNFDRKVIRANFFRTVLAWPFATLFSPIGNFFEILSIVQTKFWSDVVAGIIEGSGKYRQRFILRKRDLSELLPRLNSSEREIRLTAMLDIIYIWAIQPRGKTCLHQILLQKLSFWERWKKRQTPEEKKRQEELFKSYFEKLLELFGDPGCLNLMCEFVMKNYQGREAVILTGLIGENSESFLSWLRNLQKNFPQ